MMKDNMTIEVNDHDEISNYFKLKFEGTLSDYQSMVIVKLYVFVNEFGTDADVLERYWNDFGLPYPIGNLSFSDIFDKMTTRQWIKLQDSTDKYLYGPCTLLKMYLPSFMVNLFQRAMNSTLGELAAYFKKGELGGDINHIAKSLSQQMSSLNVWISMPLRNMLIDNDNLIAKNAQICNPYSDFYQTGKSFVDLIQTCTTIGLDKGIEIDGHDKTSIQEALLPLCIFMRGFMGFTALCGFFNDATLTTEFQGALNEITSYFFVNFHNACIYRLEFAIAPLNKNVPTEERGSKDHTTRIKLYLYDKNMTPYLVRIDMPHKGEPHLHFNVRNYDGEAWPDNHVFIENDIMNIEHSLKGVEDAIVNICPNIIKWVDSTKDDDDSILKDMLLLKSVFEVSQDYLKGVNDQGHLTELSRLYGREYSSQTDALLDCYLEFINEL